MQLIHSVIEGLEGPPDEDPTPMSAAVDKLLGGGRGSLIDLADRFTDAGLGQVMASWIGHGPNLPIRTYDLRRVLGEAQVEELATLTGMASERFLLRLVVLLPAAVHDMTPEGELEERQVRRGRHEA